MPAFSHVALEAKSASAGSVYKAVFQVGHGCDGSATTGISVQIPAGFQGAKPYPKAGWTLSVKRDKLARPHDSHGNQVSDDVSVVSWTAVSKEAALQDAFFDEFVLRGKLPETAGPLWFKVLQTCMNGSNDWSELPASGMSSKNLKLPAALLEVTGKDAQTVEVTQAWVRSTVQGQKGTGAFMSITARDGARLVGVSSPVAGVVEVHEMKMEGDIMKMRAVPVLDLPAGHTVQLKPGGYHLMLMDLKQPLPRGSRVPLTLRMLDSRGTQSTLVLAVPVSTLAPGKTGGQSADKAQGHGVHQH